MSIIRFEINEPKFIVVLAHGMNMHPMRLEHFAKYFNDLGGTSYIAQFKGHKDGDTIEDYESATMDDWHFAMEDAFKEAKKAADFKSLPLYFFGYSLGAIAGLKYLQEKLHSYINVNKMILLCPAVEIKSYIKALESVFGFPDMRVSSRNLMEYRKYSKTSLKVNEELFKLIHKFKTGDIESLDIPTLVLVNKWDELVSWRNTKKFPKKYKLTNWKIERVKPKRRVLSYIPQHLFCDEITMGLSEWRRVTQMITKHLLV